MKSRWKKVGLYAMALFCILSVAFYFCLPTTLFHHSYATILTDQNNQLLSAAIASDGQWRFPEQGNVPEKFTKAITLYEDKRFFQHIGVDIFSLARAIRQNIQAGKVVSGGSTLSMQVIRLSRKNKARTYFEKGIELILATRLELRYTKKEILALYASHAPFGGNVVGIEAACWRYFGRPSNELSWSEAALLAVLPNNPALIHLGKNRKALQQKRDRLLRRLSLAGNFNDVTLSLALAEPIPENPLALPRMAQHLLDRAIEEGKSQQKINSTINLSIQQQAQLILARHNEQLSRNKIFNAAALVVEVATGQVVAYIGNVASGSENQEQVDVVASPRSTGSILKPFLFAAMLDEGKMLSQTLQPDIPISINGFSPKNFSNQFDGAVPADKALIRSLNIPAVHELREYRYEKFYELLKNIGIGTLHKPADHYGLSLILGGAEATLWDITGAYASMARTLNNYFFHPGNNRYQKSDFHSLRYCATQNLDSQKPETQNPNVSNSSALVESSWLSASSIYLTFNTLKELYRPGEETGWRNFSSSKKIAWKTGTSHGLRDGWAVGVNADYAVGVWVGNADGEGRPGLTGTEAAAPILFELFSSLPGNKWFDVPQSEMIKIAVCSKSGYRISTDCEMADTIWSTKSGLQTLACPFHKKVYLTADKKFRIHSQCEELSKMVAHQQFVLPPIQAYYFKKINTGYLPLPPYRKDCTDPSALPSMDLVYPKPNAKIYLPIGLTGSTNYTVFEAAHQATNAELFWHLDGVFIQKTHKNHRISIIPTAGLHQLTIIDDAGETINRSFTIISGDKK